MTIIMILILGYARESSRHATQVIAGYSLNVTMMHYSLVLKTSMQTRIIFIMKNKVFGRYLFLCVCVCVCECAYVCVCVCVCMYACSYVCFRSLFVYVCVLGRYLYLCDSV